MTKKMKTEEPNWPRCPECGTMLQFYTHCDTWHCEYCWFECPGTITAIPQIGFVATDASLMNKCIGKP